MNIKQTLQLLDIQEVTTSKQKSNGTLVFKLPIKDLYCQDGSAIHVASYKSGYVRRLTIGKSTSDYQLNKRIDGEPEYFESGKKDSMGRTMYTRFTTRTCELIPNEQDRLEYLISYCLKNYYIGHANKVARSSNEYVPKWRHENVLEALGNKLQEKPEVNDEFISRSEHRKLMQEQYINGSRDYSRSKNPEVKVIINGQKYNIT